MHPAAYDPLDPVVRQDPYPYYARLRREAPSVDGGVTGRPATPARGWAGSAIGTSLISFHSRGPT